jgi:predicted XRE-type DNA-binding protein
MISVHSPPADEETIEVLRRDLAARIADHLDASGESQSQAARRLGVHQPKLSLLVRGRTDSLSLEWLIKVGIRAGLSLKLSTGRSSRDATVTVSPTQVATDGPSGSSVAAAARASRLAAEARMTPEQRIEAFIRHNAALEELRRATRSARPAKLPGRP